MHGPGTEGEIETVRTLIQGYQSFPGEHCGSVAMRGLLHHYCGLDLPECAVFGIGAGLDCVYLSAPELDPGVLVFVLLGFDDQAEQVFIADRIRPEPEVCSYGALFASRNPPEGMSTHNLWGRFHDTEVGRSVGDAVRWAIARCSRRMLGADGPGESPAPVPFESASVTTGIDGIRRLAREVPSGAGREDARWVASYNARCIEKFGNGGGNFRRLYAGFLEWARALEPKWVPPEAPGLAWRSANEWTAMRAALGQASEEGATARAWKEAADRAAAVAELEAELLNRLADAAG
jgi:hypothetical protein